MVFGDSLRLGALKSSLVMPFQTLKDYWGDVKRNGSAALIPTDLL